MEPVRISSSLRTRTGRNSSGPLTAITASWARSHWIASIRSRAPTCLPGVARSGAGATRGQRSPLHGWGDRSDLVVDISETIEVKIAALACYVSQMPDRVALDKNVRERAARLGKPVGYRYAEVFARMVIDG